MLAVRPGGLQAANGSFNEGKKARAASRAMDDDFHTAGGETFGSRLLREKSAGSPNKCYATFESSG